MKILRARILMQKEPDKKQSVLHLVKGKSDQVIALNVFGPIISHKGASQTTALI